MTPALPNYCEAELFESLRRIAGQALTREGT